MRKTALLGILLGLALAGANVCAAETQQAVTQQLLRHPIFVTNEYIDGGFKLVYQGQAADLYVDPGDQPGVARALEDLSNDLALVTDLKPAVKNDPGKLAAEAVLVGTIGHSDVIDHLINAGKLDVEDIAGSWESYVIQMVEEPWPGVTKGLVIAGSDRRGTIYGIYELSRQIGVSPWYWWADVMPEKQDNLVVLAGTYKQGEPSVNTAVFS